MTEPGRDSLPASPVKDVDSRRDSSLDGSAAPMGSFTSLFVLDDPVVEVIYPSFFVISWAAPRATEAVVALDGSPPRASWKYTVEWKGAHNPDAHAASSPYCHATIPIEFTHEAYFVRVVAKGTVLTSVDQATQLFVTARITVPTRRLCYLPWLSKEGLTQTPVLLRECLLMAALAPHLATIASSTASGCYVPWTEGVVAPTFLGRGRLRQSDFLVFQLSRPPSLAVALQSETPSRYPLHRARWTVVVMEQKAISADQPGESFGSTGRNSLSREASPDNSSLTGASLMDLARHADTDLIFTGIGPSNGAAASMAAHRLLGSLLAEDPSWARAQERLMTDVDTPVDQSEHPVHHVFCVTFGSQREEYYSNGVVLTGTAKYSGQFLHYHSALVSPAKSCGFGLAAAATAGLPVGQSTSTVNSSTATATPSGSAGTGSSGSNASLRRSVTTTSPASGSGGGSKYLTVPLGCRVSPLYDAALATPTDSSRHFLRVVASSFERKLEEEDDPRFDVLRALQQLDLVSGNAPASACYSPNVVSATAVMGHAGCSIMFRLQGSLLNFHPILVVLVDPSDAAGRGFTVRSPVSVELLSVTHASITARCSLMDLIALGAEMPLQALNVRLAVQVLTDAGESAFRDVVLQVPRAIVCLLHPDPLPLCGSSAGAWVCGDPESLLSTALTLEPLMASAPTSSSVSFTPHGTTKALTALEYAADFFTVNQPKRNAKTSFLSMVAAKVASSTSPTSSPTRSSHHTATAAGAPLHHLSQPPAAELLTRPLSDHIARRRPSRVFVATCAPWRTKVFGAFPWMHDMGSYRQLLLQLNALVRGPSLPATLSTPAVETSILTSLMHFLVQDIALFPNLAFHEALYHVMSFETFYRAVQPLLLFSHQEADELAKRPLSQPSYTASEILNDAIHLWVVAILWQLRTHYLFMNKLILVCTPFQDCGGSTVMNHLKLLRKDEELARHEHNDPLPRTTIVRRVLSETLDDAHDARRAGVNTTIVFVALLSDLPVEGQKSQLSAAVHWFKGVCSPEASPKAISACPGKTFLLVNKLDECIYEFRDAIAAQLQHAQHHDSGASQATLSEAPAAETVMAAVTGIVRDKLSRFEGELDGCTVLLVSTSPSPALLQKIPFIHQYRCLDDCLRILSDATLAHLRGMVKDSQ